MQFKSIWVLALTQEGDFVMISSCAMWLKGLLDSFHNVMTTAVFCIGLRS